MPVLDVQNVKGKQISQVELADDIFSVPVKSSVLHEVVTMQLANRRAATAAVKHRSDIRGSRKKLYRQKGTGRARRGDIKSPLLRGGGVVFGPDGRKYKYQVPKKVKKLALKMALSSKLSAKELVVLDRFDLEEIKTREFVGTLDALKLESALIVTDKKNENLEMSSRNVRGVKVLRSEGLNVYDILKYRTLVLLEPAVKNIEGRLRA
ncbi:MAG: 50S ribosomal protein L4 [Deltaproteobacteria bacterium]|jgi:large subunit ribosomal protein L4|nr:50S ribosomal protein L4 [Deltaproteobacteria bacterium]MBW2483449.1 50S ribosomal protein L4 [Deltaproteobacteria bacterium]